MMTYGHGDPRLALNANIQTLNALCAGPRMLLRFFQSSFLYCFFVESECI